MEKTTLKNTLLAIAIVMGFVFLVSFVAYYVEEKHAVYQTCSCSISLPWIIVILSSLGVFVGTITFYFFNLKIIKDKKDVKIGILRIINYLGRDEKLIIMELVKNNGRISQSTIVHNTKIDKVKVFRILEKLLQKEIIKKEKNGMTNTIILDKEIVDVLID